MKILYQKNKNFIDNFKFHFEKKKQKENKNLEFKVKKIINDVKNKGNKALIKYTKKFEKTELLESEILIPKNVRNSYKNLIDKKILNSFEVASRNIKKFHERQLPKNYFLNKNGIKTELKWSAIDSVGLYVPGGLSAYPSSFLMNIIPALVAGVKRIVVTTPSTNKQFNPYLLALLDKFNIKEVYQLGGAQAIAALAYGTKTIKSVDKIFGPGNAFVSSAKKMLFGKVGIDLIAGPSEIVVLADKLSNPLWVASDLVAQAEHDENAKPILVTDSIKFANKVKKNIDLLVFDLPKRKTIQKSFLNFGTIIILKNIKYSAEIINLIAPEHLHIENINHKNILKDIKNFGAAFVGPYTPVAFGDYIVGTNHILPTSGASRFSSGLGVIDFMKRSSIVQMNSKGYFNLEQNASKMAMIENLEAHNLSIKIRQIKKNKYK
mgnify:CR=1 FL=1